VGRLKPPHGNRTMSRSDAMSVSWAELQAAIAVNPQKGARLGGITAASGSILTMPEAGGGVAWLPEAGWTEDTTFTVGDVVSLVLWVRDPLYRVASGSVRRAMEMEEAAALYGEIDAAWRRCKGRGRGWVRKHLEEDLRARAGGAPAATDAWAGVKARRRAAQVVDYVCSVREVRVALWWPDENAVTVLPLSGVPTTAGIVQMNCTSGHVLMSPSGSLRLLDAATVWPGLVAAPFVWSPPACAPSVGSTTVAQIQERLDAILGPVPAGEPRRGGRAALWTRLLWEMLLLELAGKGVGALMDVLTDDSTGST
jgi:hypothetical protein